MGVEIKVEVGVKLDKNDIKDNDKGKTCRQRQAKGKGEDEHKD
jgi:hypothetical protein